MLEPAHISLVHALAGNSAFLAKSIQRQPNLFMTFCEADPENAFVDQLDTLKIQTDTISDKHTLMRQLRLNRAAIALLTAMADVTGAWSVQTVTARLSTFANLTIRLVADFLLREAHDKGTISLSSRLQPEQCSGLLILAMGKLGGDELNYSSDIDLIVLFDPDGVAYRGRQTQQHFFTRIAQELCYILQERTKDGYVFRTDLRLRPDPRSTPLAVNVHSAIHYYETVGQNWERAAMIKAKAVYAAPNTFALFEQARSSFIWRRHLDFAAITDIHSIKRQINVRVGVGLKVPGHHVKLGRGGIREIEFFIQTQQLLWGGREPELRSHSSDAALRALFIAGHISHDAFITLQEAYWFLRRVEHYIQMLEDHQAHTIPEHSQALDQLACFLGYENTSEFEQDVLRHCRGVHAIYAQSTQSAPALSIDGNLVFTGVEADPDTLQTLARMGFSTPQTISDHIQDWHRGGRRATHGLKARQLLTEITPALLTAFSRTAYPDDAFKRFDEFIDKVPVGVQIFSLLTAKPHIMDLLAMILGSAPALGESLARNPSLLDSLLENDYGLPERLMLEHDLSQRIAHSEDEEDTLRHLRQFKQEKSFQAGVKLLQGEISPADCGDFLTDLADIIIHQTHLLCLRACEHKYGHVPGGEIGIIGLGKLGSRELTFNSDLDLIIIYDAPGQASHGGSKSIAPYTYYQRYASRLTHAFTLLTREGALYELDMRLRPGGGSGALATGLQRFSSYFQQDGWDVEALAFTRGRVITASSPAFSDRLEGTLAQLIDRGFAATRLADSICRLRGRISEQHPTKDAWNIKHVKGGLLDLSLMAQYLRLVYPASFNSKTALKNDEIFHEASAKRLLEPDEAEMLTGCYLLQRDLQHVLRLCSVSQTITDFSSNSLQAVIARLMQASDCNVLNDRLIAAQNCSMVAFNRLIC